MMIFALLSLSMAHATTWTVDASGSGDASTIRSGVALLAEGDTLAIAAGTYEVEHVWVVVNNVVIQGAGWDSTVFDGAALESTSDFIGLLIGGENVVVDGVGFRNYNTLSLEAAVEVSGSAAFQNCAFTENLVGVETEYYGFANISIINTIFAGNSVGIYAPNSLDTLHVENGLFVNNSKGVGVVNYGEGTYFNQIEVVNSTFVGGSTGIHVGGDGRGIEPGDSEVLIVNNLFSGLEYGWYLGLSHVDGGLIADIRNNVYSPLTDEYLYPEGSYAETDNLEAEPEFVAWSDDDDWTNDDLHLVAGSPGIDAGADGYATSATDLGGAERVVDGDGDGAALPDAGAYEYCSPEVCTDVDTGDTADTADTGTADDSDSASGTADTGADTSDSGTSDTGSPADSGSVHHKHHSLFGCTTAGGPVSVFALALAALIGVRRRKA